jgi:hypothetical protein
MELKPLQDQDECHVILQIVFDDKTRQSHFINLCEAAPAIIASDELPVPLASASPEERAKRMEEAGRIWRPAAPLVLAPPTAAPPPPAPLTAAPPLPGRSELRRIQEAGKFLDRLPQGKIVLNAPTTMKVTEVRTVHANVGINVPDEVLRKHSHPGGQSSEAPIRLSREMVATLTGPAFKIVATTPEQQNVADGYPTVWSWNIEATEEGEQYLEATLYALLPSRERIDSYRHTVGVIVKQQTWGEWVKAVLNKSTQEEFEALRAILITVGSVVGSAMTVLVGWMGWVYSRRRREHG